MQDQVKNSLLRYRKRREELCNKIRSNYGSDGIVLLCAGFERERYRFRQESTFYYFTGLNDPAGIVVLDLQGQHVLYLPNFGNERKKWVHVGVDIDSDPQTVGFDSIRPLSDVISGYSYSPFFDQGCYAYLLDDLKTKTQGGTFIFSPLDNNASSFEQVALLSGIKHYCTEMGIDVHDISSLVYAMRRRKDESEISLIRRAVDITNSAQQRVAKMLAPGVYEYQLLSALEREFINHGATGPSFPSIVATGNNSTVLHYTGSQHQVAEGDLVVVDIGAEYGLYGADITRTYPASGRFSQRQKEIYHVVLDTQAYVADQAKPGMFLRNPSAKERSLHYLACDYLKKYGFLQYFPHGIGHYLGLEVHDVGSYQEPLQEGDVFTIEPGIYLTHEGLGVRIEDDYLLKKGKAICLSEKLPKSISLIEQMMSA